MRDAMLALAAQAPNAIIPAYTWGVQAQPITLGHYLSGYAAAFEREATRMREAYVRLNQSPLGSAALGTSSFPVDRPQLADLLGFDAVAENSLDANQISPIDGGAELAGLATSGALTLGALIADVTAQYAQTEPWILLTEGERTGVSSIMPQKRNPTGLVMLRAEASNLIGEAVTFSFIAHNVQPGMSDYKDRGNPKEYPTFILRDMAALFAHADAVIESMRFRSGRALEEVNSDYSHDDGARRHAAARSRRAISDRSPFRVGARELRPRQPFAGKRDSVPRGATDLCRNCRGFQGRNKIATFGRAISPFADGGKYGGREQGTWRATAFRGGADAGRRHGSPRRRPDLARDDASQAGGGCTAARSGVYESARLSSNGSSPAMRFFFFERCQTTPGKPFSGTSGSPV
jgi:hypothetical protein